MKSLVLGAVVCVLFLTPSHLSARKITILYSNATYESWRADYAPQSLKVETRELDLLLESGPKSGGRKDTSQFLDMRYLP